jgi:hypothetical protein
MTIQELVNFLGTYPKILLLFFILLPVFTFSYGKTFAKEKGIQSPHKYVYSSLVYLTCVPGIFAAIITIYSLFFIHTNLLQVNLLVYFVPIISMVVTLVLIRQNIKLDQIPGYYRLTGLMALLAATFIFALILIKTRIWLFFGGSILAFLIMVIVVFSLLKWGSNALFRNKTKTNYNS